YQKTAPAARTIETPDKQNATWEAGMRVKMSDDDPDYAAMLIADEIFGGGGGSRLFKRIRDKEGLSYGVGSFFLAPPREDSGMFVARAISAPQNAPKVENSFQDELASTLKAGFTKEEVEAAKKAWLEERLVARAQDQALARTLSILERFDRSMKFDEELEKKVSALTPEQVSEAFRRHVDASSLFVVRAGDFKKAG